MAVDEAAAAQSPLLLGGYAAIAESAWMGAAQGSDVLEPLRTRASPFARWSLRLPRLRLAGLLTREFSVAEATAILMVSFFLSAGLGAVRQVLLNAQFGAGSEANAYYAAFRLPDALFSFIAGGALSSAMIPVLLSRSRQYGEAAAWRLTSLVLTTLVAFLAVVVLVLLVFTPFLVNHILAPGFDPETRELTVKLTRIMLAQPLILAVGSVSIAVLNSRNQFLLTGLSIMSHNIALIAGVIATRAFPDLGIYGPTLGVVGGAVLQVAILVPGLIGRHASFRPALDFADSGLREVIRLLVPNGMAVGVGYAGFIVDTAFASKAAETDALPAIQNAWLMAGLPIALLGQAVGQAAFPRLAAQAAALDWSRFRVLMLQAAGVAMLLAVPALLGLVILGRPTIRVLFEHGKFGAETGDLTNKILIAYAVALPAYVATEVVTRGLIALRDTRTPLLTNTLQLGARIAIISILLDDHGAVAIPAAFAISAALETVFLGFVLAVKIKRAAAGHVPRGLEPGSVLEPPAP